jgi:hypothetical protein
MKKKSDMQLRCKEPLGRGRCSAGQAMTAAHMPSPACHPSAVCRPQELDDAVRRRLVKRIYIPLPDDEGRMAILRHLLAGKVLRPRGVWLLVLS